MDASLAGLVGAVVGAAVGLINYRVIVGIIVARLRAVDRSQTTEERAAFERKIVLLRRIMFVFEVGVFTVVGYFVGTTLGGWFDGRAGG